MESEELDKKSLATMKRRLAWLVDWLKLRQGDIGNLRTTYMQIVYFTIRTWMDLECARKKLLRINNYLKEPLTHDYIIKTIVEKGERREKTLRYKNTDIVSLLGITEQEAEALDIWHYDRAAEDRMKRKADKNKISQDIIDLYKSGMQPNDILPFVPWKIDAIRRVLKPYIAEAKQKQYEEMLQMLDCGTPQKEICDHFQLSPKTVRRIIKGEKNGVFLKSEERMASSEALTIISDSSLEFFYLDKVETTISDIDEASIALHQLQCAKGNVAILAQAGTGKTTLLNKYLDSLPPEERKATLLTAPTGIAASNISGTTIHRAFELDNDIQKNIKITEVPQKLYKIKRLVIDEIGSVRIDVFHRVMSIIRYLKRKGYPIQVIVIGDFAQIAPVVEEKHNKDDRKAIQNEYPNVKGFYAFHSELWDKMQFKIIRLHRVYRQSDTAFINQLQNIRLGNPTAIQWFNLNANRIEDPAAPYICPTNEKVRFYNNRALKRFNTDELKTFAADIYGAIAKIDYPCPDILQLAIGMRVRTVINTKTYNNGSLGTVVKINDNLIQVKLDNGSIVDVRKITFQSWGDGISFTQFPLELAYALTANKAQGLTFDAVNIVGKSYFAPGQLYVALSRVRNFEGLHLIDQLQSKDLVIDSSAVQMMMA